MKKCIPLVFLCILLFALVLKAQEPFIPIELPTVSNYVMDSKKAILTNAETSDRHGTLMAALRATDLDKVLKYKGQFTVFAPSDMAFEKLSKLTTKRLMDPKNKKELKAILSSHIVAAKLSAATILKSMCRGGGKASFTTILGEKITATINGIDIILKDKHGNKAKIVLADTNQSNCVIHEVDSVFLPITAL